MRLLVSKTINLDYISSDIDDILSYFDKLSLCYTYNKENQYIKVIEQKIYLEDHVMIDLLDVIDENTSQIISLRYHGDGRFEIVDKIM